MQVRYFPNREDWAEEEEEQKKATGNTEDILIHTDGSNCGAGAGFFYDRPTSRGSFKLNDYKFIFVSEIITF